MTKQQTSTKFHSTEIRPERGAGAVRLWLLAIAALVYAMVLVGGATRLTDSGLSITEWRPVTGAIPPLDAADWQAEFDKYKVGTAEYRYVNEGMTLSEFKSIYWWEWAHRLLGRLIGIAFLLPMLAFWALGWTTPRLRRRLWGLFGLGGLQGFVGWWMVSSGVGDTTLVDVAAYRLMTHFSLALLIIGLCVWTWLEIGRGAASRRGAEGGSVAIALLVLASLQMMLGALVAGLDAGRSFTDWPLMNGEAFPQAYWRASLGLRNFFENEVAVQFNHRVTAYALLIVSVAAGWKYRSAVHGGFALLAGLVLTQTVLGVVTLLHAAPVSLGLMHQALGTILFIAAVALVWRTRPVTGQSTQARSPQKRQRRPASRR